MIIKYVASGGLAALAHLGILYILVEFFFMNPVVASAIGFCAAIMVNYNLQYHWVFTSDMPHGTAFIRYVTVTLGMLAVNTLIFWLMTSYLGIGYLIAQILTIGFIFIANYLINRNFTFAEEGS